MSELIKSYKYQPKPWLMFLFFLCCFALGSWLVHTANINSKPMDILDIIFLTPSQASVYFYAWAIFFYIVALFFIAMLICLIKIPHHIDLMSNRIILPKPLWLPRKYHVLYNDIVSLELRTICFQTFINIHTAKHVYSISKSFLPEEQHLQEIFDILIQKVTARK